MILKIIEFSSAIVCAVLASGLIQYYQNRKDSKNGELKEIRDMLKKHIEDDDRRDAIACRVRILQFADDIRHASPRSKDSYDQCFTDLDHYNRYCDENPSFRNHITTSAEKLIVADYNERMKENNFIA